MFHVFGFTDVRHVACLLSCPVLCVFQLCLLSSCLSSLMSSLMCLLNCTEISVCSVLLVHLSLSVFALSDTCPSVWDLLSPCHLCFSFSCCTSIIFVCPLAFESKAVTNYMNFLPVCSLSKVSTYDYATVEH